MLVSPARSAVVVGAGLSGLAAAYRLRQAGLDVTVLERLDRPGGRVQTIERDGYVVDTGPDALTESYARYLALVDELGLSDLVVQPSQVAGLVRGGRIVDLDPGKPLRAAASPVLSPRAKVRLVRGYLGLRKRLRGVDSYELVESSDLDDPGASAWDFAVPRFGREVSEYVVDPVMRLVTGSGATQASCLGLLGALTAWTTPLANLRGGLRTLPDALARELDVRYGAEVTEVAESGHGVSVTYGDAQGQHALDADACVIGAMYHVARDIWAPLDGYAPGFAEQLRDVKLISVSLGYRALARTRAYVVQVPTVESPEALLIFMQHNKSPDRAPAGHSLVTIYTDTLVTDRYLSMPDDEIVAWAAGEVESLCPELAGRRDMAIVTRWPKAGYLASPGFWRRSRALLDTLPADGRVQLAGDLFGAGSMESSVRWGERAAARVIEPLEQAGC